MPRSHRNQSLHRLKTYLPKILAATAGIAVLAGGAYFAMKKSPEDHFRTGKELQQKRDYKAAEIELKNALQGAPDNGEARYLLGQVQYVAGNYPSAEKELKKALDLGAKDAGVAPLYARTLLMQNAHQRLLDEVSLLEKAASAESKAAVHALRARAQLKLKDTAGAEKSIADADALSPNHVETLAARAFLAFSMGQQTAALSYAENALTKEGQRADLWSLKGDLLHVQKRDAEALQAYAKALALEPENIPARLAVAQVHMEADALDKAQAELKELFKHAPKNVMGRYLDAFIDFRRGRYPEADGKLQEILRGSPNHLTAHLLAGAVNLAMNKREGAKTHLNKVLEAVPQHPIARKLMAATLADMGDVAQAQEILKSLDDVGNDPLVNVLRGEIALRQGKYQEARKHLEKVAAASPNSPEFFTELAASRMGSGDEAGAIEALSKAADLDNASTRPDVLLILAHVKEKRFDDALKVVDKLEKERSNDPVVPNLRGSIFVAKGDKAQARASFEKALQVKPGYFPAASNLALLDVMQNDRKAARGRFESLVKNAPQESRAWLALAAFDAREGNEAGYLKNLEAAKKANGKNVQAHAMLCRYWLDKKDGGKALAEAREAADATGRPEFQEFIGLAQMLQKDPVSAASTFTRWAELVPNNPLAHFRLSQAQMANKDREAALKSLDKALALKPSFIEAAMSKAMLLVQAGRSADALKLARGLQASEPKNASGYVVEAEILFSDKKYADAGKLFAKAADLSGQGQLLGRAHQAFAAGNQAGEGERLLEQWLKKNPNDTAVRHLLASAQLSAKRLKEAADNYRLLIRANTKDLVAYNNLAWILGELKDPQALAMAEQALKLAPKDANVMDTYGWQLTQAGQAKNALPYLRDALKAQPNNPEIRWHLAATLEATGDKRGALEELDRLLTSRMDFPQKAQAQAMFDRLKSVAK